MRENQTTKIRVVLIALSLTSVACAPGEVERVIHNLQITGQCTLAFCLPRTVCDATPLNGHQECHQEMTQCNICTYDQPETTIVCVPVGSND